MCPHALGWYGPGSRAEGLDACGQAPRLHGFEHVVVGAGGKPFGFAFDALDSTRVLWMRHSDLSRIAQLPAPFSTAYG